MNGGKMKRVSLSMSVVMRGSPVLMACASEERSFNGMRMPDNVGLPADTRADQRRATVTLDFQHLGEIGVQRCGDQPASFRENGLQVVGVEHELTEVRQYLLPVQKLLGVNHPLSAPEVGPPLAGMVHSNSKFLLSGPRRFIFTTRPWGACQSCAGDTHKAGSRM
jgi:hypothetical protein